MGRGRGMVGRGLECLPWNILDLCRFREGPRVTTGLTGNHVCFSRSLSPEILDPAVDNDIRMGWDKILNYLVFSYGVAVEFEVCFTLLFLESSQQSISYRDQRHLNRHETGAKLGVSGSNIYF